MLEAMRDAVPVSRGFVRRRSWSHSNVMPDIKQPHCAATVGAGGAGERGGSECFEQRGPWQGRGVVAGASFGVGSDACDAAIGCPSTACLER